VQIKDKGNINMRVVSLHDDKHGINQSHYNSLGSESPYLKWAININEDENQS